MYTMFSEALEVSTQHPYLGIIISHDLKWKPHIDTITAKASSTLGFLKRNLRGANKEIRAQAYTSLVRPKLEYTASVWDPQVRQHAQSNTLVDKLEAVQNRAVRFIAGGYRHTTSITQLRTSLGLPTLQQRRQLARLTLFYKSINNLIAIPIHSYLTRNTLPTRGHSLRFHTFSPKTEVYRTSFLPRTVTEWNVLPQQLVTANTLTLFKRGLAQHMGLPLSQI